MGPAEVYGEVETTKEELLLMTKGKTTGTRISALLLTAVVAGCSAAAPAGDGGGGAAGGQTAPQAEKPKAVTLGMATSNHPIWPYNKNWSVYKFVEEKTNIHLDVQTPPGNDYEASVNLLVSSGDMPDFMLIPSVNLANKYGQQGAFEDISKYWDMLPNFKKYLKERPELEAAIVSAEGKYYFFPNSGLEKQLRHAWMYREDIFKKHDLKPPGNYDELEAVLQKLKELYPDSYPLTFYNKLWELNQLAANFNTGHVSYYDYDKKEWRFGPIEDNYKAMVGYLHKFHKAGYLPPDFMAHQRKQHQDLFAQNKSFITADAIGLIDEYTEPLGKAIPEFQLAYMPPPAGGPNGAQKMWFQGLETRGFSVASTSKNIGDVMRYFDFMYSDEGIRIASWGKEGETYTVVGGKNQFKPEYTSFADLRIKTGIVTPGSYVAMDFDAYVNLSSEPLKLAFRTVEEKGYETKPQPRPAFNESEIEILSTVGQAVDKHRDESIAKFILGQRDLGEWDKYVEEMNNLGVRKVLDVHKAAYERTLKNIGGN